MRQSCVRQAVREVRWLIEQSTLRGTLKRTRQSGTGTFYGPHEESEYVVASGIPLELKMLPAKAPTEIGADAVAQVLPDCGVQEQDILVIEGDRYRVTELQPYMYFGSTTHIGLNLTFERLSHG